MTSIRTDLHEEIHELILKHLEEIGAYITDFKCGTNTAAERVVACAARLSEICQHTPDSATADLYGEACGCKNNLENFLKSMNQALDTGFEETTIGQIWVHSQMWCQRASIQFQLTMKEVWDLIAPAVPDILNDLGNGQYEARWWKPAPSMDIEILKYTDGIVIDGQPFEPPNLAGGLALRFSISRFL
jgi:hypothetical protein